MLALETTDNGTSLNAYLWVGVKIRPKEEGKTSVSEIPISDTRTRGLQ